MKHILLDVNIVVDLCIDRDGTANSALAIAIAESTGQSIWVYTGSVQTLEYVVAQEIYSDSRSKGILISHKESNKRAKADLIRQTANMQWLASLSGEGNVFECDDPEDEQLILALDRFPANTAALLTRDGPMLKRAGALAMTPEAFIESCKGQTTQPTIDFIDLKTQQDHIRPALEKNIHRVLHHGQYIMGPEVKELEEKLAAWVGTKHCVTVASGTEALLISLMALDIKAGDEVITTPFSFIATAEVIVLAGATPVFVDIEPDTCNIDAALIEAKITPRTRAIMPVSLYGQPADMDAINAIAAKYKLPVIEDAAQSFGATYKGKKSCNLSTIGCTSFFPSKPLGCYGDGGALFTNDDAIAQACREIRVHGQSKRYVHTRIGLGGRMDTLQCAIVLAKLERFDWEVEQRLKIGARYNELFAGKVETITQRPDRTSVFAQYTVKVANREKAQATLKEADIPTAVHYPVPMHQQPAYAHLSKDQNFPVSVEAAAKVMSLPMGADLQTSQQEMIVAALIG